SYVLGPRKAARDEGHRTGDGQRPKAEELRTSSYMELETAVEADTARFWKTIQLLRNYSSVRELCKGSPPPPGTPMQDQFRAVRTALLSTPFETFERAIRSQSSRALAGSDFDPARDIVAITVNRWPHGFAMSPNSLFEHDTDEVAPNVTARRRFGHITIANSDASGVDLVQTAFDEAFRAVRELEPNRYGYYERI